MGTRKHRGYFSAFFFAAEVDKDIILDIFSRAFYYENMNE
jgi:hypothetical protein